MFFKKEDNSFDFKPTLNTDINIAMAYLNLGIDSETMNAQQVWRYSPEESLTNMMLDNPSTKKGKL